MIFFALIKLIPITLTLPGIAGLVLTIGVAADSNIVIFERIKEEVRAGRSMQSAITAGYKRGISTIIDANVVTILTAFILFVLATAGVKGFAFTLGVGTLTSLLTAVVFTQALLGTMSNSKLLRSPQRARRRRRGPELALRLHGRQPLVLHLLRDHPDHRGGGALDQGAELRHRLRVRHPDHGGAGKTDRRGRRQDSLEEAGVDNAEVQQVTIPHFGSQRLPDRVRAAAAGRSPRGRKGAADEYGIAKEGFESTSVGPTFGNQVAESAVKALIFSLLVILIYVALRFEPKFAVPVLIALFHDILITGGVYALTGKEVSSGTVAAFLTILGYSLYDTIIVFDRIRENVPRMPRAAFSQIVNRSMSEVMTRSLATSFSTLLAVLSLLIFGTSTLQDFAFAMLIGIASGTYSSIFIASPVLTAWKEREPGSSAGASGSPRSRAASCPRSPTTSRWRSWPTTTRPTRKSPPTSSAKRRRPRPRRDAPRQERSRRPSRRGGAEARGVEAPEPGGAQAPSAPEAARRRPRDGNGANPESAERRKRNEERRAQTRAAAQRTAAMSEVAD